MDTKAKHLLVVAAMMIMLLSLSSAAGAVDTPAAGSQDTAITQFSDVVSNNNAIYINYLADLKIINGYPDGTYHPQEGLTRAQAAVIIAKAARLATPLVPNSGFSDVKANHWAAASIAAAARGGYIKGYPDGSFRPDQTLTRAQGISLIMRLSSQKQRDALPKLKDMNADHWAAADMGTALAAGMIGLSTDSTQVYPEQPLTRGSLARALGTLLTQDPGLYKQPLAGAIKQVTGEITILRDGKKSPAQNDNPVYQGDTITTGKGSSVNITYPDGSSVLVKENSEIYMKESVGRACMKKDGKSGMAVESVDIDLKQGSIFGALATKHEQEEKEQARAGKNLVAALGSRYLAEAQPAQPWYKEASAKKVKMKVDMPWGVAAVRGTFILVSLAPDGSCNVSCLTGDAQVQAKSGGTVSLGQCLSSGIDNKGNPTPSAPMGEKEVQAFEDVQQWLINTALQMDQSKEADAPPVVEIVVGIPNVPVQSVEQAKTIEAVLDAIKTSGIQLTEQVKKDLEQKLKETQEVISPNTLQKIEDISAPEQNTQTNTGGGGTTTSSSVSYVNYSTAGTYGPTTAGSRSTLNNVIISAAGVTLQNLIITKDLTLAAGIGDGSVTLKNVQVLGNTLVYGGGPNSIHIEDCDLYKVIVDNKDNTVRIVAQGNTSVGALTLNSGAKLEESGISGTGAGFSSVATGADIPPGATIILSGNFESVEVAAPGLKIQVAGGNIGQINLSPAAGGTALTLAAGVSVSALQVNAVASIGGDGEIVAATINSAGVVMEKQPAHWSIGEGISATIGGQPVSGIGGAADIVRLSDLILSSGALSPSFAPNCFRYAASVANSVYEVTVSFSLEEGSAAVAVNGTPVANGQNSVVVSLPEEGDNPITIAVTSAETVNYYLTITRAALPVQNSAPEANNVRIVGTPAVGETLAGRYDYYDADLDPEDASIYKWYSANSLTGEKTVIGSVYNYTVTNSEAGKYIFFAVTPVAASGERTGETRFSSGIGMNSPPEANNVRIVGTPAVGETLEGRYDYYDADRDPEDASVYKWYSATSLTGEKTVIGSVYTYTVTNSEVGKYIFFAVTPVAASGERTGEKGLSEGLAIANHAPSAPVITKSSGSATDTTATDITIAITTESVDVDGDQFHYIWITDNGQPTTTAPGAKKYTSGQHTVRVKAQDDRGMESEYCTVNFWVLDSTTGTGGLALVNHDSYILSNVVAGATVSGYTFTVQPVTNHNSQYDRGEVEGLRITGTGAPQWETIVTHGTHNGITFKQDGSGGTCNYSINSSDRTTDTIGTPLSQATYLRLRFHYYTDHQCMLGHADITYSVTYAATLAGTNAPAANGVAINSATATANQTLTGTYTYSGGQTEASLYQWFYADDSAGKNISPVPGATSRNYTVESGYSGKYLFFEVIPVTSTADGLLIGSPGLSTGVKVNN